MKEAETTWTYPQYSTIREMIWRQQDSYLTIWLHEPRAEIDLGANDAEGRYVRGRDNYAWAKV